MNQREYPKFGFSSASSVLEWRTPYTPTVGGNFSNMRVTITFFLVAGILALVYWAWTLTPSRLEYHPLTGVASDYEDIKKIMNSTDIEFLRQQAIGLKFDKEVVERDSDTITAMNILGITVVLTFITLVLLFLEIAARGRTYRQQKL